MSSAALVIGFSIQGLAIARSLANADIKVYVAIPGTADDGLGIKHPSRYTQHAEFLYAGSLRGEDIPRGLNEIRRLIPEQSIVLFPTTDDSVIALAEHWSELDKDYRASWSSVRKRVLELIHKGSLPALSESAGVKSPKTVVISERSDIESVRAGLRPPILTKPDRQSFSFKTHLAESFERFEDFADSHAGDWPLVAQELVQGPEPSLFSFTCFVRPDGIIGDAVSRKLRSSPPARGIGTMFDTVDDPAVSQAGRRVAERLNLLGPVAIEFKRDADGNLWLIEANVGRVEFCVDLMIASGLNLPLLEFELALSQPGSDLPTLTPSVWYDTSKEPLVYLAECVRQRTLKPFGKRQVFPYFGRESLLVNSVAAYEVLRNYWRRVRARIRTPSV